MNRPVNIYLKADEIDRKPLDEATSRRIFKLAVFDYLGQKIDDEDLESIASYIYYEVNKPFDIESNWDNRFGSLLATTTDIAYIQENNVTEFEKLVENLEKWVR